MGPDDYDRQSTNDDDGRTFYGYDDDDSNKTYWYDEDGNLDSVTDRPYDDD